MSSSPVLPLHGPRRRDLPEGARFPGEDVLDNMHGAAQSVWDVGRIVSWIHESQGDVPIGVTSRLAWRVCDTLVASFENGLASAIVGVPAVDLTELIERHWELPRDDERHRFVALAKRLGRVVSPLALTPRVPHEGRFIYAGLADRLVHPSHQVTRLWQHWGRPEIAWYQGGRTTFTRSKYVGRFVRDALVSSGLVEGSRSSEAASGGKRAGT